MTERCPGTLKKDRLNNIFFKFYRYCTFLPNYFYLPNTLLLVKTFLNELGSDLNPDSWKQYLIWIWIRIQTTLPNPLLPPTWLFYLGLKKSKQRE